MNFENFISSALSVKENINKRIVIKNLMLTP